MSKKLHIGIIGSSGNLGSDLVSNLGRYYKVTGISRENYSTFVHKSFDILINANGNSKRFFAIQNPQEDFKLSTESVLHSLFDFKYKQYIYISSSDVYKNHTHSRFTKEENVDGNTLSAYGFHKYLSERIVMQYAPSYIILRCSMMLGTHLRKGPIFDLLHNQELFISKNSKLQMITTDEIGEIIHRLLTKKITNGVFNAGGVGTVPFSKIETFTNRNVQFKQTAEKQIYEMSVEKLQKLFPLKTSSEYLQNYLNTIQ